MNWLQYIFGENSKTNTHNNTDKYTVGVAESVTAGAVSTALCSEPGASDFFRGSIVAYSIQSKKELLGIDVEYAERNNFANPFTTEEMAKAAATLLRARIGIATTGYSLPIKREADPINQLCALDVTVPYAYIALYDTVTRKSIIRRIDCEYNNSLSERMNRANMQAKVAAEARSMYKAHLLD